MPGPGSRDRERRPPDTPVLPPGGSPRSDGQANGGNLGCRANELFPETIGIKQTYRETCSLYRRIGDLARARGNSCVDGLSAANPRPSATPDPIRRGTRDSETAH